MTRRYWSIEIEDAEQLARSLKADYLRAKGWKNTCQVPGSHWVWVKEHEGQHLMAPLDSAVRMQQNIDAIEPTEDTP